MNVLAALAPVAAIRILYDLYSPVVWIIDKNMLPPCPVQGDLDHDGMLTCSIHKVTVDGRTRPLLKREVVYVIFVIFRYLLGWLVLVIKLPACQRIGHGHVRCAATGPEKCRQ